MPAYLFYLLTALAVGFLLDVLEGAVGDAAAGQPGALLHALEGIIAEGATAPGKTDRPPVKRSRPRTGLILAGLLMLGVIAGGLVYQDDINALIVEHAIAGRTVVRLKGGDPLLYGRGGEEAEELLKEGIDFEIIPGIPAAIAAAAARPGRSHRPW